MRLESTAIMTIQCFLRCLSVCVLVSCSTSFRTLAADWKSALMPATDAWKDTPQIFTFNNGAEPESIDPALITGVPESRIVNELFEGLVTLDPKTLEPRPGVADRWEISDDGLVYRFHIRDAARWSNGSPVTAMDFYRSWKRVLTPSTGAAYVYQLYAVKGAAAYSRGEISSFDEVGISVPDRATLRVELAAPCTYFLDLVAFHTLMPVPVDAINAHGDQWVHPTHFVGNGPYVLKSWEPRQKIELVPNDDYWDRSTCKLERVVVLPYDDVDTSYKLFLQGKIHWLPAIPIARIHEVQRNPDYYAMPYLGTYFYRLNVNRPPFDDVRVRKAFSMALNRESITRHVLKGGQQPASWFCPPVAGYEPVKGLQYDPEGARRLLRDAGVDVESGNTLRVELLYNTSEAHKKVAEAVAAQWKKNLNVTVALRNSEWKVLLGDMSNLNYQIVRSSWVGDYGDPNTFFDMWITGGGNNRTGWSNARYDALLAQAAAERDKARRNLLFQEMERILVEEELPIIPLYIYVNQGLLDEAVCGWFENVRDYHPLKYIWLEE